MIKFYTDGSCRPTNPGPGSFGVIEIYNDPETYEEKLGYHYYQKFDNTTNNRMELSAINHIMQRFSHNIFDSWGCTPIVYTDSTYAINTLTDWMFKWEQNDWKKADGNTPENLDIIQEYFNKWQQGYRIDLRKVKAHSTDKWNNIVDNYIIKGELTYK